MARNYIRTTTRGYTKEQITNALHEVISDNKSIRETAKKYGLCHVSLSRYVKKIKCNDNDNNVPPAIGYNSPKKVFSEQHEQQLCQYIKNSADMYFGLTPRDIRQLAYQFALRLCLNFPKSWEKSLMAGPDWFSYFLKRNSTLSLRQPEATSLSRAMNFNKQNVKTFMDKYEAVLKKYKFEAQHIYNIDETGITTVQAPSKIVATKGKKQIGSITSAERGVLVTMCLAINGTGNAIPPMFIFPRVKFQNHFLRGGPIGCIGTANKSGWMQGEEFLQFMKHFVNYARPSINKKVLVLLDNHESHLYLPVIDFCRDNGVVLLSFPPHCSHKLQPLDRCVYGPFKKYVNKEMDRWMTMNPGKRMTIYDIPQIAAGALPDATSPRNITSGFKVSGIHPFNPNVFGEDEFLPSIVTDIELQTFETQDTFVTQNLIPTTSTVNSQTLNDNESVSLTSNVSMQTPHNNNLKATSSPIDTQTPYTDLNNTTSTFISPEHIRPYPKATIQNKLNRKGRKKGKSAVLTDTPEKIELEAKYNARVVKRNIFESKSKVKKDVKKLKKTIKPKKAKLNHDSTDEEDSFCLVCMENYNLSKSNEEWIQCNDCKFWTHTECSRECRGPFYLCDNCN